MEPYIGTIIGGCIGFASSLLMLLITRWWDRRGKVYIYCRRVNLLNSSWGFEKNSFGQIRFLVPLDIEIMNTSNVNRIVRDFNISAWHDGQKVFLLSQCNDPLKNWIYSNANGFSTDQDLFDPFTHSYSFVAQARSVSKEQIAFAFIAPESDIDRLQFDELRVEYANERGACKTFAFAKYLGDWKPRNEKVDKSWIELKPADHSPIDFMSRCSTSKYTTDNPDAQEAK